MGATSFGVEDDAGTYYPTLIQDSNGNQVQMSYQTGAGAGWGNSSGRLTRIHDAVSGSLNAAFTFGYDNGAAPHLQTITSAAGREAYSFAVAAATLTAPFAGGVPVLVRERSIRRQGPLGRTPP